MIAQLAFDYVAETMEATDRAWRKVAQGAIGDLAARGQRFTVDDVWDLIEPFGLHPSDDREMGRLMKSALAAGVIRSTGDFVRSRRATKGGRFVMVWIQAVPTC